MSEKTQNRMPALSAASFLGGIFFISLGASAGCPTMKLTALRESTQQFINTVCTNFNCTSNPYIRVSNPEPPPTSVASNNQFPVDRKETELIPFNAVGLVRPKNNKLKTIYGSSTLISKCYVLTNRHVVMDIAKQEGRSLKINQNQLFSVGQKCTTNQNFEFENLNTTLVAFGKNDIIENDWAILKLDAPIESITPPEFYQGAIQSGNRVYAVGYPQAEESDTLKHSAVRAARLLVNGIPGNTINTKTDESESRKGFSGGSLFAVTPSRSRTKFEVHLAGLLSTEGKSIPMNVIGSKLQNEFPEVYNKIINDQKTDGCP